GAVVADENRLAVEGLGAVEEVLQVADEAGAVALPNDVLEGTAWASARGAVLKDEVHEVLRNTALAHPGLGVLGRVHGVLVSRNRRGPRASRPRARPRWRRAGCP